MHFGRVPGASSSSLEGPVKVRHWKRRNPLVSRAAAAIRAPTGAPTEEASATSRCEAWHRKAQEPEEERARELMEDHYISLIAAIAVSM